MDQFNDDQQIFTEEERQALYGSSEPTAERIHSKRINRKRRRLLNFIRTIAFMTIILVIGFIIYAASESNIFETKSNKNKAGAAELAIVNRDPMYECFGTVGNSSLEIALPGKIGNVTAVAFHEAERREAIGIKPTFNFLNRESTTTVRLLIAHSKNPVLFVMATRWRGSSPTSAMDIAMLPESEVYAPITGVVRVVKMYNLYGKVNDYHIEIEPVGYPDLRIAIIHIKNPEIRVGDRVIRRKSLVGYMRTLPPSITAQINKYLPTPSDHVHIQVNPASIDGKLGS